MTVNTDKLNQFFEQLKTLTFWQRLFKWSRFNGLAYEAYEQFKALLSDFSRFTSELDEVKREFTILGKDKEHLTISQNALEHEISSLKQKIAEQAQTISQLTSSLATKDETLKHAQEQVIRQDSEVSTLREKYTTQTELLSKAQSTIATQEEALRQAHSKVNERDLTIASLNEKLSLLSEDNSVLREENAAFRQTEEDHRSTYEANVASINAIREQIQTDRSKEIAEANQKEIDRLNRLRETWANHQEATRNTIKLICERHTIEYVEKVPFKGDPDNTLKICDEYVIFDAKSPGSDDLANFPTYIKTQTESLKKYIKQENVRKDIYLVIPSNTVHVIDRFSYNMADYTVFVVTRDALEPIILSLKKLEEYEFVDQLSPEERDNICRVIGKFAHMTKRRIQIDQFFARQFLDVLSKCESDLPREIIDKVIDYERSEKLNPSIEKRAKLIPISELESDNKKLRKEAEAKAIAFPVSVQQGIKSLPLYADEATSDPQE